MWNDPHITDGYMSNPNRNSWLDVPSLGDAAGSINNCISKDLKNWPQRGTD